MGAGACLRMGEASSLGAGSGLEFRKVSAEGCAAGAVVEEIRLQREQWLSIHDLENLTREDLVDHHRMFSQRYENLLNEGSQSNSHPKNEICLLWGIASVLNGIAVRVCCPFRFSFSDYIDDLSGLSGCEFCVSVSSSSSKSSSSSSSS